MKKFHLQYPAVQGTAHTIFIIVKECFFVKQSLDGFKGIRQNL